MSKQIIKQPDGRLAVFSDNVDGWVLFDATPEEVLEYFEDAFIARVFRDLDRLRKETRQILQDIADGQVPFMYRALGFTFEEADSLAQQHTGKPLAELQRRVAAGEPI